MLNHCAQAAMRIGLRRIAGGALDEMALLSFLRSLFGGGRGSDGEAAASKQAEHKGFVIEARPYKEGGQYQAAGVIKKDVGGVVKEHKFIRADRFSTLEDAADFSLAKGRQIVDEQGERLFG
jgi:hypothetical protein